MEFYIGSQFSREFSFEESRITHNLAEQLNAFFGEKYYGEQAKNITVGIICVSKSFELFFPVRPLKILKKSSTITYELKLDFKEMIEANESERKQILATEFLSKTKEIFQDKIIKDINKEEFIKDLELFFLNLSYK